MKIKINQPLDNPMAWRKNSKKENKGSNSSYDSIIFFLLFMHCTFGSNTVYIIYGSGCGFF